MICLRSIDLNLTAHMMDKGFSNTLLSSYKISYLNWRKKGQVVE
jgi:hypothetical protein